MHGNSQWKFYSLRNFISHPLCFKFPYIFLFFHGRKCSKSNYFECLLFHSILCTPYLYLKFNPGSTSCTSLFLITFNRNTFLKKKVHTNSTSWGLFSIIASNLCIIIILHVQAWIGNINFLETIGNVNNTSISQQSWLKAFIPSQCNENSPCARDNPSWICYLCTAFRRNSWLAELLLLSVAG